MPLWQVRATGGNGGARGGTGARPPAKARSPGRGLLGAGARRLGEGRPGAPPGSTSVRWGGGIAASPPGHAAEPRQVVCFRVVSNLPALPPKAAWRSGKQRAPARNPGGRPGAAWRRWAVPRCPQLPGGAGWRGGIRKWKTSASSALFHACTCAQIRLVHSAETGARDQGSLKCSMTAADATGSAPECL